MLSSGAHLRISTARPPCPFRDSN